jgi:hypothetical protein
MNFFQTFRFSYSSAFNKLSDGMSVSAVRLTYFALQFRKRETVCFYSFFKNKCQAHVCLFAVFFPNFKSEVSSSAEHYTVRFSALGLSGSELIPSKRKIPVFKIFSKKFPRTPVPGNFFCPFYEINLTSAHFF